MAKKRIKALTSKSNNPNHAGSIANGDPDSNRDMGPPDTTDVGRPNFLNLRNDNSPMMAGNIAYTASGLKKTLEDEVRELNLVNQEP